MFPPLPPDPKPTPLLFLFTTHQHPLTTHTFKPQPPTQSECIRHLILMPNIPPGAYTLIINQPNKTAVLTNPHGALIASYRPATPQG